MNAAELKDPTTRYPGDAANASAEEADDGSLDGPAIRA
jgi:hypothetical protein